MMLNHLKIGSNLRSLSNYCNNNRIALTVMVKPEELVSVVNVAFRQ